MWLFKHPETITPDLVADDDDEMIPEETGAHCAWCGDPPDAYGSHSICAAHAEQQYALLAARRERRAR